MINGDAAPGYSSGDAIKAIEEVAKTTLPKGYTYEWSGMTREEIQSGDQALYIFAICPGVRLFTIGSAVRKRGVTPAVHFVAARRYFRLVRVSANPGAAKQHLRAGRFGNADWAFRQKRHPDCGVCQPAAPGRAAHFEGCAGRVRFAAASHSDDLPLRLLRGLIPLCMASGAGALGNRSIGTAAAGGMFIGTVFGLILVPGLYVFFAKLARGFKPKPVREKFEPREPRRGRRPTRIRLYPGTHQRGHHSRLIQ